MCLGKIGCSKYLYGRWHTYLTGCPPGLTPSYDITFDAIWETTATSQEELYDLEEEVHNEFHMFRMMRNKPGDSEWFDFEGRSPLDTVRAFMNTRSWVKR